jgi:hypothetical protein
MRLSNSPSTLEAASRTSLLVPTKPFACISFSHLETVYSIRYSVTARSHPHQKTNHDPPLLSLSTQKSVQQAFLMRWCNCSSLVEQSMDVRSILDWQYYRDRLS